MHNRKIESVKTTKEKSKSVKKDDILPKLSARKATSSYLACDIAEESNSSENKPLSKWFEQSTSPYLALYKANGYIPESIYISGNTRYSFFGGNFYGSQSSKSYGSSMQSTCNQIMKNDEASENLRYRP